MLAKGPEFFAAAKAGKQTRAYRRALEAAGVTHADVVRGAGLNVE